VKQEQGRRARGPRSARQGGAGDRRRCDIRHDRHRDLRGTWRRRRDGANAFARRHVETVAAVVMVPSVLRWRGRMVVAVGQRADVADQGEGQQDQQPDRQEMRTTSHLHDRRIPSSRPLCEEAAVSAALKLLSISPMDDGDSSPRRESAPRCDHAGRRVIHLRWPYVEASIVRARLVADTGNQFDVSPLYRAEGCWAFTICRECAKRGIVAIAVFLLILAVP